MNIRAVSLGGFLSAGKSERLAGPAEYRSAEAQPSERAPASTPARAALLSSASNSHLVAIRRFALVAGCVVAVVVALFVGRSASGVVESELLVLLRGMAVLKGCLVLGALGVVLWRLGHPASPTVALGYMLCVWVLAGSTVLIWQLSLLGLAAALFHAAEIAGLVLAWRDGKVVRASVHQAPNPSIEATPKSRPRYSTTALLLPRGLLSVAPHVER